MEYSLFDDYNDYAENLNKDNNSEKNNYSGKNGNPDQGFRDSSCAFCGNEAVIYTDGGCHGNPGPGGWAFAMLDGQGNLFKSQSGGEKFTTNNRMELTAVIEALKEVLRLKSISFEGPGIDKVKLFTDSQYVKNGITSWIFNWKKKGWRTSGGDAVKNQEYWIELDSLNRAIKIEWNWVKGHAGNTYNEMCDANVQLEIAKFEA